MARGTRNQAASCIPGESAVGEIVPGFPDRRKPRSIALELEHHDAVWPEADGCVRLDQKSLVWNQSLAIDESPVMRAKVPDPHAFGTDHQLGVPARHVRVRRQFGSEGREAQLAADA